MAELSASFGRDLQTMAWVRAEHGVVSGRRYRAICAICRTEDDLTFTAKVSAERRLKQHRCGQLLSW